MTKRFPTREVPGISRRILRPTHTDFDDPDNFDNRNALLKAATRLLGALRYHLRYQKHIDSARVLCLFVASARSGHTMVRTLLDAHGKAAIANEYGLLSNFHFNYFSSPQHALTSMLSYMRRHQRGYLKAGGYYHHVPFEHNGEINRPTVIGDKFGYDTTRLLHHTGLDVLTPFVRTLNLQPRIIHILRNPYDVITTMCIRNRATILMQSEESPLYHRSNSIRKILARYGEQIKPEELQKSIPDFVQLLRGNLSMIEDIEHAPPRYPILRAYYEDIAARPHKELEKILNFLNLEADANYYEHCAQAIKPASLSHHLVPIWDNHHRKLIEELIDEFEVLHPYRTQTK